MKLYSMFWNNLKHCGILVVLVVTIFYSNHLHSWKYAYTSISQRYRASSSRQLLMDVVYENPFMQSQQTVKSRKFVTHRERYAALHEIICEDKESMGYFPWREDWTWHSCPYSHDQFEVRLGRKVIPGKPIVPVFVIFNDKVTDLKEFIRSMHTVVHSSFQIIIIETASHIPEALDFADWMRKHHMPVVYTKSILNNPAALNSISWIIDEFLRENPDSQYYVVTDPDLSLFGTRENILEVYADILNSTPDIRAVGPSLRIDDLPANAYTNTMMWQSGKAAVDWELKFWPDSLRSISQSERHQKVYFAKAPIDTTFAMYRRGYKWHRMNKGYRLAAPYDMKHTDWYYSPTSGIPVDMIKYTCLRWTTAVTHVQLPDCAQLLSMHNISASDPLIDAHDGEVESVFDSERLARVIGQGSAVHIRVGNMPLDYKRFGRHRTGRKRGDESIKTSNVSVNDGYRRAEQESHQYWVEISPNLNDLFLTDRHLVIPFMALPYATAKSDIVDANMYSSPNVSVCDSIFTSKPDIAASKKQFMKDYDDRCNRLKKKIKKHKSAPTYARNIEVIRENSAKENKALRYSCYAKRTVSKRRALPLSYILDQLAEFPIRLLDIASDGADAALLYSIEARLHFIEQVRCRCQVGAWYHNSSVPNSCGEIQSFLELHGFMVGSLELYDCGMMEYVLHASKKAQSKEPVARSINL